MDIELLRNYCLKKPNSNECLPFGNETLVFKTNGKIFLLVNIYSVPIQFNVKCNPDKAIDLRETYSCVLPGYHMNKKHWNTIVYDNSVPEKIVFSWIDDSYNLVKSKK